MITNNQNIPQFPETLPGSFWGITTFFNPSQYKNKLQNYRRFRMASKNQGLKLLVVELAFGDTPFELSTADADILIQRRANSVMWQKERLLNIAVKNLPADCDKVAWVDADVIFQNNHWIQETSELLEVYPVVQPFQYALMLPKGVFEGTEEVVQRMKSPSVKITGKAYKMAQADKALLTDKELYGHPGFAWAARRNWLERVGFYDKLILGSADYIMALMYYRDEHWWALGQFFSTELVLDIQRWQEELQEAVQGSVFYTPGNVLHLWHGSRPFRFYEIIHMLYQHGFTPQDIRLSADECWEWVSPKKHLHQWAAEYFQQRNEEGSFLNAIRAIIWRIYVFEKFWKTSRIFARVDWAIGQIGLFLKRHVPAIYYFLKRSG